MAKVLLIRPPLIMPAGAVTTSQGVPSIGVAYLCGALKAAGHEVVVIDAFGEAVHAFTRLGDSGLLINGLSSNDILERIPADVDVIGVSCMYSNEWLYHRSIISAIVDTLPEVPVVLGGEHVTADPEYSLRSCPGVACGVLGEGEETIVEVVDALARRAPLADVPGVALLDRQANLVMASPRTRINDVDDIPLPSWDETPLENYLSNGLGMNTVRGRPMPMLASRGCPYRCTFCSNPQMWTTRWYARDPQLVVDEMKLWIERYKVDHFEFYDLTTIVRRDWILSFTRLVMEQLPGITWDLPSGTRSEALDRDVVRDLYASGCRTLTYAPESGSPVTLKRIKKKVRLDKMSASMRWSVRAGIYVKANLIIGLPDQTMKEVRETYAFILKMAWLGVHDVAVFPFVPYPGSELFYDLVREGKIPRKDAKLYDSFLSGNVYNSVAGMLSWSEHISHAQLKWLTLGGMALFYVTQFALRPWRLIGSAVRLVRSRPFTMFERAVDGIVRNLVKGRKRNLLLREVLPGSVVVAPQHVAVGSGRAPRD